MRKQQGQGQSWLCFFLSWLTLFGHLPFFGTSIAHFATLSVLRFGIPVRVVSDTMGPSGKTSFQALVHQWQENQRKLMTFVEGLNKGTARRAVFSHPFAGPLHTRQIVRLAAFHFDSRLRQIRRNLRLLEHEPRNRA